MRGGLAPALAAACAVAWAAPAVAEDPPFVSWTPLLPSTVTGFSPSAERDCANGDPTCIDRTLVEMERRFRSLLATCDHNAVFGLTYIRVTEIYRRADRAGMIEERDFLAHEDAVFARMYFDAYDAWARGDAASVAPAWREAFDRARQRKQNALGNMLHGMNAHVNRDMPIMLAAIGLVQPGGGSRKRDHDRFNELLNQVYDDVLAEVLVRFDEAVDDFDTEGTRLDDFALFQLLPIWREAVWRNAELLSRARGTEAQRAVVSEIEAYALAQATVLSNAYGYGYGDVTSAWRDARCAAHGRLDPSTTPARDDELAVPEPPRGATSADRLGRLTVPVRCRTEAIQCPGRLTLERGGTTLGNGSFLVEPASSAGVELRLGRRARRMLRSRRSLRARLVARMDGVADPVVRTIRLRGRR